MVLNQKINIRESPRTGGNELYAVSHIRRGEWIWKETDDERCVPREAKYIDSLPEESRRLYLLYSHQIGEDAFVSLPEYDELPTEQWHTVLLSRDLSKYMNHSCTPNCWFQHSANGVEERCALMVASRDIEEGEEVTFDYVLSETHDFSPSFKCQCGSVDCRGQVTTNDWRMSKLQEKYAGHFLKHVALKIAVENFTDRWKLRVENSPLIGRYLCSEMTIPKGALVMVLPPNLLLRGKDVIYWNRCVQVDDDLFSSALTERDLDNFLAHSCDPTCDMVVYPDYRVDVIALREIPPNSVISFDYNSTEDDIIGQQVDFVCQCGAPNCHGLIGGKKYISGDQSNSPTDDVLATLAAALPEDDI